MAMTSILGAGNSSHKIGGQEGPIDTVYLGVFRRELMIAAGCFDETLLRNEDYELNWRLRSSGETVWLDPDLLVDYQPRRNLNALWKQYFEYGRWKAIMLRRNPSSLRLRQLAAPALVVGLLGSAVFALVGLSLLAAPVPLVYLSGLILGSMYLSVRRCDMVAGPILPFVLSAMHLGWGTGFLVSCVRMGFAMVRTGRTGA